MEKIITLTGHTYRVLYLAMNPVKNTKHIFYYFYQEGTSIVTGAGDETLRFWNIFPSNNK